MTGGRAGRRLFVVYRVYYFLIFDPCEYIIYPLKEDRKEGQREEGRKKN